MPNFVVSEDNILDFNIALDLGLKNGGAVTVPSNSVIRGIFDYLSTYNPDVALLNIPSRDDAVAVNLKAISDYVTNDGIRATLSEDDIDTELAYRYCTTGHVASYLEIPINGLTNVLFYHVDYASSGINVLDIYKWITTVIGQNLSELDGTRCIFYTSHFNTLLNEANKDLMDAVDRIMGYCMDHNINFIIGNQSIQSMFASILQSDKIYTSSNGIKNLLADHKDKVAPVIFYNKLEV